MNGRELIYKKIRKILLNDWDPIGIQGIPEAQDEYDNYVPLVYGLLISRKSEDEIFNYLYQLETEQMGLSSNNNKEQTRAAAKKIASLTNLSNES
ncbi:MAG: hypothetical protein AAF443_00360 [Chlamydiota bacterium]